MKNKAVIMEAKGNHLVDLSVKQVAVRNQIFQTQECSLLTIKSIKA